jgi:ABC-type multidrug transport system permease subunit
MRLLLYGYQQIVLKEFTHIRRDPTTLFFALLIPVMQLILFGYAIDFDVRHIQTAVVDMDQSRESRAYLQSLESTHYLDIVSYLPTPDSAEQALRRNDERVAVIIPPDFSRRYGTDRPPVVRVLLDGSDSQVASPVRNALMRPPSTPGPVEVRANVMFNPDIRTQVYTIPGLVCVLMQMITVSLTSFSLVREREQGTMEQLMVSPVGRLGLILGKVTPYSILGMVELLFVLYLGRLIFNVQIVGSLLLLMLLAIPFIIAALSMGLVISAVAKNQSQALQMTMLTVLPSVLLSGYIAPRQTLPGILYLLSCALPVTHFIQISRAIVVRGADFADVIPSVINLVLIASVLLVIATLRFHKSAD